MLKRSTMSFVGVILGVAILAPFAKPFPAVWLEYG